MLLVSASEAVKHAAPLHTCDEVWSVLLLTVEWEMSATEGERATVHPVHQGCVSACVHERERHRTFSSPEDSNAALARELAEHGADGAASPALLHNECLGGLLWWGEGGEVGGHGLSPGDGVGEETGLARGEVLGGTTQQDAGMLM